MSDPPMFDPHLHLSGILPYRVLGLLATEFGGDIERAALSPYVTTALLASLGRAIGDVTNDRDFRVTHDTLITFLAHHELRCQDWVIKIKPEQDSKQAKPKPVFTGSAGHKWVVFDNGLFVIEAAFLCALLHEACLANFSAFDKDRLEKGSDNYVAVQGYLLDLAKTDANWSTALDLMKSRNFGKLLDWCQFATDRGADSSIKAASHALQNAFTASPITDFDTAYVWRGKLPGYLDPSASNFVPQCRAIKSVLKYEGTTQAEPSVNTWLLKQPKDRDHTEMALNYAMRDDPPDGAVRLRWLYQIPNPWVADPLAYPDQQTDPLADPEENFKKFVQGFGELLRKESSVAGFSILAPETEWYDQATFQTRSGLLLNELNDTITEQPSRRLVAHIHIGEGAPAWAQGLSTAEQYADLIKQKRTETKPEVVYDQGQQLAMAEHNIDVVLASLEQHAGLISSPSIRVRLGHVTHISRGQADRITVLNRLLGLTISADINLTSNLATGALWLSSSPSRLDLKRIGSDPELAKKLFIDHGIHKLDAAGVPFIIGTDGGGVEHSNHNEEYEIAAALNRLYPQASLSNAADYLLWAKAT